MCDQLSQVYSSVYLSLGQPTSDLLSKLELGNMVVRHLSYRLETVRQSEQGIQIAKSSTFTLAANENSEDLTALEADFVIPMWVERQAILDYANHPVWQFVPTVNISMLQQKRAEGVPAVAFYGSNPREVIAEFSYFGNDVFGQSANHRVWYLPTLNFPTTESGTIDLPENLVNVLVYDTLVSAIPLIKVNMSKQLKDRPELKAQMDAYDGLMQSHLMEQARFEKVFNKWVTESRGGHRPRRRPDVLHGMAQANQRTGWYGGS